MRIHTASGDTNAAWHWISNSALLVHMNNLAVYTCTLHNEETTLLTFIDIAEKCHRIFNVNTKQSHANSTFNQNNGKFGPLVSKLHYPTQVLPGEHFLIIVNTEVQLPDQLLQNKISLTS